MRVLLINPSHQGAHYKRSYSNKLVRRDPPPMSILSVGTELKKRGAKVDILDTVAVDNWLTTLSKLLRNKYDWIGLSVIIGQPMANAAEIQSFIRKEMKRPPPIKWGGVMPTVMPARIKEAYGPDEVVPGPCGELGAIDWTLLGDKCNREQKPYYQMIMSSRGCPYSCTFCYKHSVGSTVQYRSAEDVCAELDWLAEHRGITVFTFGDDNFLTRASRAIQILNHCRARGYYVEECIGHINNLTDPLIEAMRGIVQTFIYSIETVNPYLQDLIKKRVRLREIRGKMQKLAAAGIVPTVSFMIGLPGETEHDRRMNQMFMGDLREAHPYIRGNCYLWLPLPNTGLTADAEQIYNISLDFPTKDYEKANFWLRHDDPFGHRFRLFLSETQYHALVEWGIKFNEDYKRPLREDGGRFYILDEVLAGRRPNIGNALI